LNTSIKMLSATCVKRRGPVYLSRVWETHRILYVPRVWGPWRSKGLAVQKACARGVRRYGHCVQMSRFTKAPFSESIKHRGRTYNLPSAEIPRPGRQTCPLCRGTRGVRHPMTGQSGPCPRCKGIGSVYLAVHRAGANRSPSGGRRVCEGGVDVGKVVACPW
jgi:hypothetical protein